MANALSHVMRGDLITASKFNEILDKLYELESRIEDLESSEGVVNRVMIDRFVPITEQHVDRTLEIYGENFEIPPSRNRVTIDGVVVEEYGLSTVRLLRVIVPGVQGVPKNALVTVENRNGTDSRLYRILEEAPVAGDPPLINNIVHGTSGSGTLSVGGPILVEGANFAADPSNNTLRLRSREPGHESDIYEITDIDVAGSSVNQIRATLPANIELVEDHVFPGGPIRPDNMEIELIVGAHDVVLSDVQVVA